MPTRKQQAMLDAAGQYQLPLPRFRWDQWKIAMHPAKTKVLSMGRRWGKTILALLLIICVAAAGGRAAWIVPTYKNGNPLWREAERVTGHLVAAGIARKSRSERVIEFDNGGFLGIYSADNEDSVRGENFDLIIVDEAARISQTAWTDAIRPTLADRDGEAILISTPKGRNWFWHEWLMGVPKPGENIGQNFYMSFKAPSAANPNPNIRAAAEAARRFSTERTYQQEWLAEFLEDAGLVFRGVRKASTASIQQPIFGHPYIFGVDWGRTNDFTVISIIDALTRQQVYLDVFNDVGWQIQRDRIATLYYKWRPQRLIIEANSIGEPNIEALRSEIPQLASRFVPIMESIVNKNDGSSDTANQDFDSVPAIEAFWTTGVSKPLLVEDLQLAIEHQASGMGGGLELLNSDYQIGEFEAFEEIRTANGFKYGAPPPLHDDTVIATALAWYGVQHSHRSIIDFAGKYETIRTEQEEGTLSWARI